MRRCRVPSGVGHAPLVLCCFDCFLIGRKAEFQWEVSKNQNVCPRPSQVRWAPWVLSTGCEAGALGLGGVLSYLSWLPLDVRLRACRSCLADSASLLVLIPKTGMFTFAFLVKFWLIICSPNWTNEPSFLYEDDWLLWYQKIDDAFKPVSSVVLHEWTWHAQVLMGNSVYTPDI